MDSKTRTKCRVVDQTKKKSPKTGKTTYGTMMLNMRFRNFEICIPPWEVFFSHRIHSLPFFISFLRSAHSQEQEKKAWDLWPWQKISQKEIWKLFIIKLYCEISICTYRRDSLRALFFMRAKTLNYISEVRITSKIYYNQIFIMTKAQVIVFMKSWQENFNADLWLLIYFFLFLFL